MSGANHVATPVVARSQSQREARTARFLSEVLAPILAAAVLLPLIGSVFLALTDPSSRPDGVSAAQSVIVAITTALPGLCIVMTVANLRGIFFEYEHARYLSLKASAHFRKAGGWAVTACGLKFLAAPLVSMWALRTPLGSAFEFGFFDVGIVVVAVFVLMIGNVLESVAAALKAENDEIV